jgi:hypothetical protein
VSVVSTITHNHYSYRDAGDAVTQRLRVMLDEMMAACDAGGVKAKGATLKDVADDVLSRPPVIRLSAKARFRLGCGAG